MFLGVDVGGSKTHFMLVDTTGRVCASYRTGSGNWEGIGLEAAAALYQTGVATVLEQAGVAADDIRACAWGLAGLDWPSDEPRLRAIIEPILPHATHLLVNDAEIALRAGATAPYGVCAIAGTGSTVVARGRTGQRARTFGLGSDWGDFDGAQALGRAALRAAAHAVYGVDRATTLTEALLTWSGAASIPALAEAASRGATLPDIATFAPVVMAHATAGDHVARRIVTDAAVVLGQNIAAMARTVGLHPHAFEVVLAGGVATSGSRVFADTISLVVQPHCPHATVLVLDAPPVHGALILAAESIGRTLTRDLLRNDP